MKTKHRTSKILRILFVLSLGLYLHAFTITDLLAARNGSSANGSSGSGDTGSGDTGSGDTGSGDTGSGDTGSGDTGSGDTGSGDTSSGSNRNGNSNNDSSTDSSSSGINIGTSSGVTNYYMPSSHSMSGDINIVGEVVMVFDGDFDIGNNALNVIAPDGKLTIYTEGNITTGGNPESGINNEGLPSNLIIIGTHPEVADGGTSPYTIKTHGNGSLSGAVYIPNANFESVGGGNAGETLGAIVAHDIDFKGSPGPFYFDEALRDLDLGTDEYDLTNYLIRENGNAIPTSTFQEVVGKSDYETLFDSLFGK